jgi:hypothetical protein
MRRLSIFSLICLLFAGVWSPVLAAASAPRQVLDALLAYLA